LCRTHLLTGELPEPLPDDGDDASDEGDAVSQDGSEAGAFGDADGAGAYELARERAD